MRPNLSLTAGLRYEVNPPFRDATNQLGNFNYKIPGGQLVSNRARISIHFGRKLSAILLLCWAVRSGWVRGCVTPIGITSNRVWVSRGALHPVMTPW